MTGNTAVWRKPTKADEGREFLVYSEALIDEDVCPDGVSIGTVLFTDATVVRWCLECDEYHDVNIPGGFLIADLPKPPDLEE